MKIMVKMGGLVLALVAASASTMAADVTTECDPEECDTWSCEMWCDCFEQELEDDKTYENAGCTDDGSNTCICGSTTLDVVEEAADPIITEMVELVCDRYARYYNCSILLSRLSHVCPFLPLL